MSSNMVRRLAVAAVGIPAAAAIVYVGGWPLAAALAVLGALGAVEFYRLGARGGLCPLVGMGVLGAALLPLATFAALQVEGRVAPSLVIVVGAAWIIVTLSLATFQRRPTDRPLASVALTVFGALYAGGLPAFLLPLRHAPGLPSQWAASALVFLPLVVTWVGDSLAMAGGAVVGGPKLAPVLSPNKTWAGAVAGALGALVLTPAIGLMVLAPLGVELALWQLAVFGVVIGVVGQLGDLAESLFKREAGVKDSGAFFPGHGGVLDRLDSLYWVLPTSVILMMAYGVL
jgi:phosphatidate cytidylyltransferase